VTRIFLRIDGADKNHRYHSVEADFLVDISIVSAHTLLTAIGKHSCFLSFVLCVRFYQYSVHTVGEGRRLMRRKRSFLVFTPISDNTVKNQDR